MSQLCTYKHPLDHQILAHEGSELAVNLSPGALVRHGHHEGTMGTLVANGDDFITVLWSCGPDRSLERSMQQQIADEIDADILRIMRIQVGVR